MSEFQAKLCFDAERFQRDVRRACDHLAKAISNHRLQAALRKLGEHVATGEALDALALERGVQRAWLPASRRAGSHIGEDDEALRQRVLCESRRPVR